MKYRHATLAKGSWREFLKQYLLLPRKCNCKPKTGNVWLYKGCLIDKEAKIRLDSNVGGLFHGIS